jgi:hypothetical protein
MPLRFFKYDKTHWTVNILASLKFGLVCGILDAGLPYVIRRFAIHTPPGNEAAYILNRISVGIVTMVLFSVIYYILLILFDLHFENH